MSSMFDFIQMDIDAMLGNDHESCHISPVNVKTIYMKLLENFKVRYNGVYSHIYTEQLAPYIFAHIF